MTKQERAMVREKRDSQFQGRFNTPEETYELLKNIIKEYPNCGY